MDIATTRLIRPRANSVKIQTAVAFTLNILLDLKICP